MTVRESSTQFGCKGLANPIQRKGIVTPKQDKKYIEVNHDETEINKSFEQAGIEPDIDCYKCYSAE